MMGELGKLGQKYRMALRTLGDNQYRDPAQLQILFCKRLGE